MDALALALAILGPLTDDDQLNRWEADRVCWPCEVAREERDRAQKEIDRIDSTLLVNRRVTPAAWARRQEAEREWWVWRRCCFESMVDCQCYGNRREGLLQLRRLVGDDVYAEGLAAMPGPE